MSDHKKNNNGNKGKGGNNQTLDYGDGSFELITPTASNQGNSWKTKATGDREVFAHLTKDRKPVQYAWNKAGHSLLSKKGSAMWDSVFNFDAEVDSLKGPSKKNKDTITDSSGTLKEAAHLNQGLINKILGNKDFSAHDVGAFECKGFKGTFVVFNDGKAGFQESKDALVFLDGVDLASQSIEIV